MSRLFRAAEVWKRHGLATAVRLTASLAIHRSGQFSTRLPCYPYPIWMRGGSSDISALIQVLVRDEYDFTGFPQYLSIRRRYDKSISHGETPLILDCGANIGLSTIWFACHFPLARIIAVEPSSDSAVLLRKNTAPFGNIDVIEGAVWDTATRLSIVNPTDPPWALRMGESDTGTPACTLDQLAAETPILIAKVDIEGGEEALFRSNTGWMRRTDLIIVEVHDWLFPGRQTSKNFLCCLANDNFDLVARGDSLFAFRIDPAYANWGTT